MIYFIIGFLFVTFFATFLWECVTQPNELD